MPESELTISIKNKFPVELLDLTNSLLGIADEFQKYILENDLEAAAADTKLTLLQICKQYLLCTRLHQRVLECLTVSP